jgi:hypothetical protein
MLGGMVEVWDIDYLFIPYRLIPLREWLGGLLHLRQHILTVSYMLRCHPAIALAFILCNIHIEIGGQGVTVIKDGGTINIKINNERVSPHKVRRAYSRVRNNIIGEKRKISGVWARPRDLSERVENLQQYREQNRKDKWIDFYEKWSSEFPHWKYNSLHSMQSSYYRSRTRRS